MSNLQGHYEDSSGNILLPIPGGMVAKVETGTTASQKYTKGTYLYFDNKLCKASATINSGATLTIGNSGNLTRVYMGNEITAHLRASSSGNYEEFSFTKLKNGDYN